SLFTSVFLGFSYLRTDILYSFSGSKEMAAYMKSNLYDRKTIIAYNVHTMTSLLPYLPSTRFWDPGINNYYTYIHWDNNYLPTRHLKPEEVVHRAFEKAGPNQDFVFLLPFCLLNPEQFHLTLEHSVYGERITGDEIYFLYRPKL
ncbi:MAG: hypothetical protein NTU44_01460, partial [Bacteroidetes bacterium]|nr:hypothetical protein [Bacteroidota bacterium]